MPIEGEIGRMIEGEAKEEVLLDGIVEVSSIKFQIYTGRSQDMLEFACGQYLQVNIVLI